MEEGKRWDIQKGVADGQSPIIFQARSASRPSRAPQPMSLSPCFRLRGSSRLPGLYLLGGLSTPQPSSHPGLSLCSISPTLLETQGCARADLLRDPREGKKEALLHGCLYSRHLHRSHQRAGSRVVLMPRVPSCPAGCSSSP